MLMQYLPASRMDERTPYVYSNQVHHGCVHALIQFLMAHAPTTQNIRIARIARALAEQGTLSGMVLQEKKIGAVVW